MSVNLLLSPNSRSIYSQSITLSKGFSYPDPNVKFDDTLANYSFIDAPIGTGFNTVKNDTTVIGSMVYINIVMLYDKPDNNTNPLNPLKIFIKTLNNKLPAYRQVIDLFVTLEDPNLGTVAFVENINGETVIDVRYKSEVLDPVKYEQISNGGIIKITGCYFV